LRLQSINCFQYLPAAARSLDAVWPLLSPIRLSSCARVSWNLMPREVLVPSAVARSIGGMSTALPYARGHRSSRALLGCRPLPRYAAYTRPRTCGAWPWAPLQDQECRLVSQKCHRLISSAPILYTNFQSRVVSLILAQRAFAPCQKPGSVTCLGQAENDVISPGLLYPPVYRVLLAEKPIYGGMIPAVKRRLIIVPTEHRKTPNNER